jgi:hypothetical protein
VPDRTVNRGDSRSLAEKSTHHLTCARADQRRRTRSLPSWSCQPRARTGRKPGTLTSTKTTTKPVLTSIAAVEFRPGIDMVRRRSTVRFRNGDPRSTAGFDHETGRFACWCSSKVLTCRPAASYESASQPTRQLLLVQQSPQGPSWSPSLRSASRVAEDTTSV